MTAPAPTTHSLTEDGGTANGMDNRFLLSAIAFLRSKQLSGGATARIARHGHKPTYIAVLEVRADTISWTRE